MAATSDGAIWRPKIVLLQVLQLGGPVAARSLAPRADARERCVVDHRQQRAEAGALLDLRVRQAQGAHRAAVEAALEGDDPGPMGVIAGQLDRALHRLGARVGEEDAGRLAERGDGRQALHQLQVARLVEVGGGDVDEAFGLLLDGGHDLRVRMAGRADRDARREVQEAVAVDIGHDHAVPGLGDERVGAGQRGAGDRLVALDDGARLRPRQLGDDVRRDRLRGSRS